jgi:predicted acyltransferase (DUF342 family)
MANNKIYLGDIGTLILVNMGEDISAAEDIVFLVKKPNNSEVEWDAEIGDDDNVLEYIVEDGDLDQAGVYYINPSLKLGEWIGLGDTVKFTVLDKYKK